MPAISSGYRQQGLLPIAQCHEMKCQNLTDRQRNVPCPWRNDFTTVNLHTTMISRLLDV